MQMHKRWTCGHSEGRRGWDELSEEHDMYILPYVKDSGNPLYGTGRSAQCSVMT